MTTAPLPLHHRAALDLGARGRAGSLFYVPIWLLIVAATDLLQTRPLLAWCGLAGLVLTSGARFVLGQRVASLYPSSPTRWMLAYASSAAGIGLVWGLLNATLLALAPFEWVSVLSSFATAGVVAGGTVSLTTHTRLARIYVVAMLLPSALVCFALASLQGLVFGILFTIDIVFMVAINRQASAEYWTALRNTELLEQRAAQLEVARATAEAADRAKSRFVATMSHEIRTPLNGVFGTLELLRRGVGPADQARYLMAMERSAHALLAIIDDVLDFSKIEAGMLTLERTAYAPATVVGEVCELFQGAAQTKGLLFTAQIDGLQDCTVLGDPTRLRQVLSNLVANAVKFTAEGAIVVQASCTRLDDARVVVRFAVRDSGIGMSPVVAARVFEAFEQADVSTTRRHGGTGLGLAISRQLVDLMGGVLVVDSAPGRGSEFSFELTLARTQPAAAAQIGAASGVTRFDGLRVLLVEDNPVNQLVAEEILAALGCSTVVADHGAAALDVLEADAFDLVLMDCQMPELDGCPSSRSRRTPARPIGATRSAPA